MELDQPATQSPILRTVSWLPRRIGLGRQERKERTGPRNKMLKLEMFLLRLQSAIISKISSDDNGKTQ
jgi:hypothetical protein